MTAWIPGRASRPIAIASGMVATCVGTTMLLAQGPAPRHAPAPRAPAAAPVPGAPVTAPGGTHELTATDLEAFLDGLVPLQLSRADIAGAVVTVVKDGKILFAKGYGYADVARKTPVSPDSTLFRPGSVSKLFTWTAVMQLVEQGKIDLDRDVNTYLDFQIPPAFGKPITMRDLMTHRPGFNEEVKDLTVASAADLSPLAQYIKSHLPARIYPPGTVPAYSNYGATLAGYIVQRVSGQPFDDYIEQHILQPLEMTHTTFRQPLPAPLAPLMSKGYALGSDSAKPFELINLPPAGAASASGIDIAHFMIAHLQDGRYGAAQILKPATAEAMHARQSGWPGSLNAMCLGFYEESRNGHRIIGHGGDTDWFHSDLHLIPDLGIGFFVSYNSAGRDAAFPDDARAVLFHDFLDRYYPAPLPAEATLPTAIADGRQVAGTYATSRRTAGGLLSAITMLGEAKVVANAKDSTIVRTGFERPNGRLIRYREVRPLDFRAVDGPEQLVFATDASGYHIAYNDFPAIVDLRVDNALDKKDVNFAILGCSLGVIILTLLAWPIAAMVRVHYGRPLALTPEAQRLRRTARIVCLLICAFIVVFGILIAHIFSTLGRGADGVTHLVQVFGAICIVGAVVVIYGSVRSWWDARQWAWTKVWNTLLALACVGFIWFVLHWHLLNFNLNY